ncbi:MAG: hypothetical protein L0338_36100 [Acidobacteria bacterium]|nr:hypothetical protein [Acidobacteriota bacterium]
MTLGILGHKIRMAGKGSKRLSVRLDKGRLQRLQQHCQEAGIDLSRAVRQAVDAHLGGSSGSPGQGSPSPPLALPDEVLPLTPKYLGWGNGDLRKHFRSRYLDLLAESYVCKKHYPRTPGMQEAYESLRQLFPYFR